MSFNGARFAQGSGLTNEVNGEESNGKGITTNHSRGGPGDVVRDRWIKPHVAAQQGKADNTAVNNGDHAKGAVTADQQTNAKSDVETTRTIRRAISIAQAKTRARK